MRHAEGNTQPIEVWLRQRHIEVTCHIVFEDETEEEISVNSLSMRGAEREITAYLISCGYEPAERWQSEAEYNEADVEVSRKFRRAKAKPAAAAAS